LFEISAPTARKSIRRSPTPSLQAIRVQKESASSEERSEFWHRSEEVVVPTSGVDAKEAKAREEAAQAQEIRRQQAGAEAQGQAAQGEQEAVAQGQMEAAQGEPENTCRALALPSVRSQLEW
jgi:hypothetical protein